MRRFLLLSFASLRLLFCCDVDKNLEGALQAGSTFVVRACAVSGKHCSLCAGSTRELLWQAYEQYSPNSKVPAERAQITRAAGGTDAGWFTKAEAFCLRGRLRK